jgi:hypothetical protein
MYTNMHKCTDMFTKGQGRDNVWCMTAGCPQNSLRKIYSAHLAIQFGSWVTIMKVVKMRFTEQWLLSYNLDHSMWTAKPGLQKARSRAQVLSDPKHKCILAPVFIGFRSKPAHIYDCRFC